MSLVQQVKAAKNIKQENDDYDDGCIVFWMIVIYRNFEPGADENNMRQQRNDRLVS